MRDAKLDTTQIEKQVAVLRQQDAAYKAELANQGKGKEIQQNSESGWISNRNAEDDALASVGQRNERYVINVTKGTSGTLPDKFEEMRERQRTGSGKIYEDGGSASQKTYPEYIDSPEEKKLYNFLMHNGKDKVLDAMAQTVKDSGKEGRPMGIPFDDGTDWRELRDFLNCENKAGDFHFEDNEIKNKNGVSIKHNKVHEDLHNDRESLEEFFRHGSEDVLRLKLDEPKYDILIPLAKIYQMINGKHDPKKR